MEAISGLVEAAGRVLDTLALFAFCIIIAGIAAVFILPIAGGRRR